MHDASLRAFLTAGQFWALELAFALVVITTIVEARRLHIRRSTVGAGLVLAMCAWFLSSTVAPRTSRIYYDEQIYQGIGRNLTDLHRAQMCNGGDVEYGRLQCWQGEYNKEPYGFPYLLSLIYRTTGVNDRAAFRLNNIVFGLAVLITVLLAELLFEDIWISIFSGLLVALFPMQIQWSNTAASEPAAAAFCAASALAVVHFARVGTTTALAWAVAVCAFATTLRPECIVIVPIVVFAMLLIAPEEFRRPRLWIGGAAGLLLASVTVLHMIAVRNEAWGASGTSMAWRFARSNFATNFWFYFADERFPAVCGVAALIGVVGFGRLRERVLLIAYFLAFWTTFLFFYAGSYNYGADVRYSLMTYVPMAVLGAVGLKRIGDLVRARSAASWRERTVCVSIGAAIVVQFLWYVPLVRAVGEEAWAARADVKYAKAFAESLPANSLVLTHNPSMFHIWGVSAAQMSMVAIESRHVDQLFSRYSGGIYLHWNFWCNVQDRVQNAFCTTALDVFPHEAVDSRRERDYRYVLYRLQPRDVHRAPQGALDRP